MSEAVDTNPSENGEPLHVLAEHAVTLLVQNQGPLKQVQAAELMRDLARLPDEDLADALFSLQRVAGYFYERLKNDLVASQLLDICYDMTPELSGAAKRLGEKAVAIEEQRRRACTRINDSAQSQLRATAPQVGFKPKLSINALRPRTKFA